LWLILPFAQPACAAADSPPQRIEEAFSHNRFDKALWTALQVGAQVEPRGGQLKVLVPKGPPGRPPLGLKARFRIEGDFDAQAAFTITSWQKPKKDWINVEIFVEGPDGSAAVIRNNNARGRSGYCLWYGPPPHSDHPGAYAQVAADDRSGTLRLKRSGEQLEFFFAGPGSAGFRQLGAVDFGTAPIATCIFRVTVPETESPVDVAFGKIEIEAERLIGLPVAPGSALGRRAWLGTGALLLVAGGLGAWAWRRAKRREGSRDRG
jgi:hypothetical protein